MTKIYIQGVLVSADYDIPELESEIANGVMCPSSRILKMIEDADGDDLQINISSEGGDVFAFNEVANRLRSYDGNVFIVIGSCAFSEAANLALTCGRPLYVHPNSVMLWHSAMSTVENAAIGELRAEADILEKINAPVKKALLDHGVPAERVEEGFRDGQALVMGADELVEYGIAEMIDGLADNAPTIADAVKMRIAAINTVNERFAAHFDLNRISKMNEENKIVAEVKPDDEEKKECAEVVIEDTEEEKKPEEESQVKSEETVEEEVVEKTEETTEEKVEDSEESDELDKVIEVLEQYDTRMKGLDDRISKLEESLVVKTVEVEEAKKALKAERTKRIGAIAAAISGNAAGTTEPKDWSEAVKACNGDKLAAYKQYPNLCKAWVKSN